MDNSHLVITFKEDLQKTKQFIKQSKSFINNSNLLLWKKAYKLIQSLLVDQSEWRQLTRDQLSKLNMYIFLIREELRKPTTSSTNYDVAKLLQHRLTYIIFHDCVLLTEQQIQHIKDTDEKEFESIIDDNQQLYQALKPRVIVSKELYEKYFFNNNQIVNA